MNRYAITLKHDNGSIVIKTSAMSIQKAIDIVCKSEQCTESVIKNIEVLGF